MEFKVSDVIQLIAILSVVTAVVYGILKYIQDFLQSASRKREGYYKSFDIVVSQLSSDNKTSQLSAAILLRRYLTNTIIDLHIEAVNVISSILKVIPTGVLQKTLGDGLAYAKNLSKIDLQNTNLQNLYLGRKDDIRINMKETDMFMADISYATLNNIDGQGAIFLDAILYHTQIKKCDFTNAYFKGTDLSKAYFEKVKLYGANFCNATNLPIEFEGKLSQEGIFMYEEEFTTPSTKQECKTVFFSMPGCMSKEDEILTKDYKAYLENELHFEVIYYQKDEYPEFGQFNKIRQSIQNSSAMIAFGFKQISIKEGISHPNTQYEQSIKDIDLPTPWNELEVGMGLMNNIPILLVKSEGINSGAFDNKLSECFVATITKGADNRDLMYNPEMKKWLAAF